ncbi:MAG TPA: glucose-1-phosphate adenylyltransferase [Steroidobacteraceae bacterium]
MNVVTEARFVSRLTRDTLALVLAGGRGSRLSSLTDWRAKPAVPFGGKFRIIDFPLSNCLNSGIRRIAVLTQYKSHSLILHIQKGWGFLRGEFNEFIELLPAQQRVSETAWYAGTADAVYQNIDIIRHHNPSHVLVLAGDHVYKMDYGPMLAAHVETGADITVGCIEVPLEQARSFGVMAVDAAWRVIRFAEKPRDPQPLPGSSDTALASMGIYVFATDFLIEELMRDAADTDSNHDFGRNIIPGAIERCAVNAYSFRDASGNAQGYWRDVGTVDSYWQANMELIEVAPELNLYDQDWPIWTYQEQLPPAKFVFDDADRRGTALNSMIAGGCIVAGATIRRSVLFPNVRVEARSDVDESVVLPNVRIGKSCRIRRTILDKGCVVPDHFAIGYDRDKDSRRFHMSPAGITLVTPDMLGQALHTSE